MTKNNFYDNLNERGFIFQSTNEEEIKNQFNSGVRSAYIGFDATASSLHVGSLLPIMMLRWLQKSGHKPIILVGGGTTKVGDPSGKDETRKLITQEIIDENIAGIVKIFSKFIKFGNDDTDAILVNNDEWLSGLNYIEFLRDYGRHFTINKMLSFESVKQRLDREQPLTFLEFNYMLLQAYDFMELNKKYDCILQMGGSDQWGNIVNGIDLTRRVNQTQVFGLTSPLLTTSSGAKMGKSVSGAVWLNEDKLSNYDYWQFWRNTEDADAIKFMKLFTDLPLDEIKKYENLKGADINQAKIVLANEATKLCRGDDAAKLAYETSVNLFEKNDAGGDLPFINISNEKIDAGFGILNALVEFGFSKTNSDARRNVEGGGVKLNDVQIMDVKKNLSIDDFSNGECKLSQGKKKVGLIKLI